MKRLIPLSFLLPFTASQAAYTDVGIAQLLYSNMFRGDVGAVFTRSGSTSTWSFIDSMGLVVKESDNPLVWRAVPDSPGTLRYPASPSSISPSAGGITRSVGSYTLADDVAGAVKIGTRTAISPWAAEMAAGGAAELTLGWTVTRAGLIAAGASVLSTGLLLYTGYELAKWAYDAKLRLDSDNKYHTIITYPSYVPAQYNAKHRCGSLYGIWYTVTNPVDACMQELCTSDYKLNGLTSDGNAHPVYTCQISVPGGHQNLSVSWIGSNGSNCTGTGYAYNSNTGKCEKQELINPTAATQQQISDALTSAPPPAQPSAIAEQILKNGGSIAPSTPVPIITGPSTTTGPVIRTTNPDGSTDVQTPTTTWDYSLPGNVIAQNTTTTVHTPSGGGTPTTTTTVSSPEPGSASPSSSSPFASSSDSSGFDLCKNYPGILSCKSIGDPDIPQNIPTQTKTITYSPQSIGGGSGQCPGNKSMTLLGKSYQLDYSPVCTVADGVRPILIAVSYLFALFIIFMPVGV
jgi:Neisseria meningitidis TspB protein